MKLKAVRIKNFRGCKNTGWIAFSDLTGLVGKNDAGKSTILDALNLFFDSAGKLDVNDLRKGERPSAKVEIACAFCDLPEKVVLDDAEETTLADEHLLNDTDELVIVKRYIVSQKAEVVVWGMHPSNPHCAELLLSKDVKLRSEIEKKAIPCEDKSSNVAMRRAIWRFFESSLKIEKREIRLKPDMVDRLLRYLPNYYLFKADRDNTEDDDVVRKPINAEIVQLIKNGGLEANLKIVANGIIDALNNLMKRTLVKMKEVDIPLLCDLKPYLPDVAKLKWADVFRDVTLVGDDEIPMEKRGSGIRRLILLSFLRAVKELGSDGDRGLIYAIEEPETAQHCDNQKKLMQSLKNVSGNEGIQVIVTTHSAAIAKEIGIDNIRIVDKSHMVVKVKKPVSSLSDRLAQSLNFVAFRVFGECLMEYHNELYGFIEAEGLMEKCGNEYVATNGARLWKRAKKKEPQDDYKSLCYYVRNSIHHPENTLNTPPTEDEIRRSITFMESFIKRHSKEFRI